MFNVVSNQLKQLILVSYYESLDTCAKHLDVKIKAMKEYISYLDKKKSQLSKIKMYNTKVMTIIEGCPSIFKNESLIKHFGGVVPTDLVKKLLLSGEMDDLKAEIDKLGGYDKEDSDEDIKN